MATEVDVSSITTKSVPELADLFSIPGVDLKWYDVGFKLHVNRSTLQNIQKEQKTDLRRKREMFKKVLEARPRITWKMIIEALVDTGCEDGARRVCEDFDWPLSLLDRDGRETSSPLSEAGYVSEEEEQTTNLLLESLQPPLSDPTTRSASDSIAVDSESPDEWHSAASASEELPSFSSQPHETYAIPSKISPTQSGQTHTSAKSATTNLGRPSQTGPLGTSPGGGGGFPRVRTELKTGFGGIKSFRSDLVESTRGDRLLTMENLSELVQALYDICSKWFSFGLMLDVPMATLRSIEANHVRDLSSCLRELLSHRIKTGVTWRQIIDALRRCDMNNLAEQLTRQYLPSDTPAAPAMTLDLREPLCDAVTKGDLDRVIELVERRGADVNVGLNEDKHTALMIASVEGHKEIVKYLLDKKVSVSVKDINGATVVYLTASVGNYEILKVLLGNHRAQAEINTKDKYGSPVLIDPAVKGFSMVTEYLLENGARPNDTTNDGVTALYAACQKGQKEVVKVLVDHGADVIKTCPKTSKTPLQEVIDSEHTEIVAVLVKAIAKVNERSRRLVTCRTVEGIRNLVAKGANVDYRHGNGLTPLIVHVQDKEKDIVQELIRQKANVDLQTNDGMSALMIAAKNGDSIIVQILIGAGAILDFKEKERGHTAMILATIGLHTRVVKELALARADINIKSRDGRTALDMARALNCKEVVDLLSPPQSKTASDDPFISLLSRYITDKEPHAHPTSRKQSRSDGGHQPLTPKPATGDDGSSMKDELKKSYRRIADLETRIHDLTLQTALEVPVDTDLSYLDRGRMESEFRKIKELKRKAEQYAIEAKQTAQRLSAENFKLKEDLSKERHHNDLTRKNMLREMEQRVDKRAASSDLVDAKKEVFEMVISDKAHQLLRTIPRSDQLVSSDLAQLEPGKIKDVVLNFNVKAKFLLTAVSGLPYSGKTTLVRNMLTSSSHHSLPQEKDYQIHGFSYYEAIIRRDVITRDWAMIPSEKQDAEAHAIATVLVQLLTRQHQHHLTLEKDLGSQASLFNDTDMDNYFMSTYKYLSHLVFTYEKTNTLKELAKSSLTFMNIFDIGMNKAVFEIMSILGRRCSNVVLLNVLNLQLYGTTETLCGRPKLSSSPSLTDRYSQRGDDKLMALFTARDYFLQMVTAAHGYSKETPSTIIVGTHVDKMHSDEETKKRKMNVSRLIHRRAEELGVAKVLVPGLIDIDATKTEQCGKVRDKLLELIEDQDQFEIDTPLNCLFLRCFLNNTKKMFISRKRLKELAEKVDIKSDKKLEKFLEIFLSCGSLFCSPTTKSGLPFLHDYIILDPAAFIQEMDKLYYLESWSRGHRTDLELEVQNTKVGIVTDRLAKKIWTGNIEEGMTSFDFCLKALSSLQIIVEISKSILTAETLDSVPTTGISYFMPTVRTEYSARETNFNPNSLFITYDTDIVPFHKLAQFVVYLQKNHEKVIKFKPSKYYNVVEFEWFTDVPQVAAGEASPETPAQQKVAAISIYFHSEVVEVRIKMSKKDDFVLKEEIYSIFKTACVHVFHQTSLEIPAFRYKLAISCTLRNPNDSTMKRHYLPFRILATNPKGLFCPSCDQCTSASDVSDDKFLWVRAQYRGPQDHTVYPSDVLSPEKLLKIASSLSKQPSKNVRNLEKTLGYTDEAFSITTHCSLREHIFALLFDWTRNDSTNSMKDLALLLLQCGYYTDAVRLDPDLLKLSKHLEKPEDHLL